MHSQRITFDLTEHRSTNSPRTEFVAQVRVVAFPGSEFRAECWSAAADACAAGVVSVEHLGADGASGHEDTTPTLLFVRSRGRSDKDMNSAVSSSAKCAEHIEVMEHQLIFLVSHT